MRAIRFTPILLATLLPPFCAAQPTYTRDIAPILQAKCQQCHRENDIAPFALNSYEAAVTYNRDIARAVDRRIMPPWKPVEGHGEFRDSFALTEEERHTIRSWVDAGAPEGDPADAPPPLPERGEWVLGEPDLALQMPEAYEPPEGRDMYRCFVLPTEYEDTRFISAMDILPGNRRSVHHVILFLDTTGEAEKLDEKDPGPGYTCFGGPGTSVSTGGGSVDALLTNGFALGGWAPGTRPRHLPDGIGLHLPPKARVIMQIHYYARGGTAPDQTRIGLYFTRAKVDRRLLWIPIVPLDQRGRLSMEIPAGASDHEISVEFGVPPLFDAHLVNIFPHMHLLGTEIKVNAVVNKENVPLIYIDKWDFNWQGPYTYKEPIAIPAGSRVQLSCRYNNSESNPRNPSNPLRTVTWGEGTEDEMCLALVGLTLDREQLQ